MTTQERDRLRQANMQAQRRSLDAATLAKLFPFGKAPPMIQCAPLRDIDVKGEWFTVVWDGRARPDASPPPPTLETFL